MIEIDRIINDHTIYEVAHRASQNCRWNGAYKWVSLAEHLCMCVDILSNRDILIKRMALVHDVVECLTFGDIVSFLKENVAVAYDGKLDTLRKFECDFTLQYYNHIWKADISKELYNDIKPHVKQADVISLELEKSYFGIGHDPDITQATPIQVNGWERHEAKTQFLDRYESLKK